MDTELRFRVKNIGPIDEAELELGNLTIIAGRNNTGKTYLAYTLYGFLSSFREILMSDGVSQFLEGHFRRVVSLSTKEILDKLRFEGQVEWKMDDVSLNQERVLLIQEMARVYSESGIASVFNTSQEAFRNALFEIEFSRKLHEDKPLGVNITKGRVLSFDYDGARIVVSLTGGQPSEDPVEPWMLRLWLTGMYPYTLLRDPIDWVYQPFILSSQRLSVSLFYKQLDMVQGDVVRLLQLKKGEGDARGSVLDSDPMSRTSRFSLPIHDNINFARDVPEFSKGTSGIGDIGTIIDLINMVGGRYEVRDDAIRFISSRSDERKFDMPLHLASSSAGEMSYLYFFLRYLATERDYFLIIDEPESHLDTANQIQVARLLARLVNSGTKVLITTHSDYIVKEINNLIMLNNSFKEKEEAANDLGYRKNDHLDPEFVRAYIAENNTLKPCTIDTFGIDMPVFDKTIDDINRASDDLASRLMIEAEGE